MDYETILKEAIPCLRLLTNTIIDEEIARLVLNGVDMEIIFVIQTVLILGMEQVEKELHSQEDTLQIFISRRSTLPADYEDRTGEITYILQPKYKDYLKRGMLLLAIL